VIAVVIGPPGSGKGTQASRVATRLGIPHVATGDILRAEIAKESALGRELEPIIASGALVPDDLILRIIEARLSEPDAASGALLDGFPRTVAQAKALDAMLEHRGSSVDVVVLLQVPEDELWRRMRRRAAEEGRPDDTDDAFRHRLVVYQAETAPVLDYYRSRGTRIAAIDGVGSVDDVTERISVALTRRQRSQRAS